MWALVIGILGPLSFLGSLDMGYAEPNFCGMKDPDPEKTCISIRLPWQEQPVYFCTEKENIHYRNQCGNHQMHCSSHWNNETLLIATPWDCCPLASVPDHCVNAQCPPAPFNRTCEKLPSSPENSWECCPKYFCEETGGSKKDCHFKQLQPGCTSPPKDKTNCVGFYDMHGCCTRYQCDGEGKPGMCPMQMQAMKYAGKASQLQLESSAGNSPMMTSAGTTPMMMEMTTSMPHSMRKRSAPMHGMHGHGMNPDGRQMHMGEKPPAPMDSHGQPGNMIGHEKHSYSISVENYPPMQPRIACVGDFNCPGVMKCCSSDISVYSDGMALPRNSHPTHGHCVDPIMA